MYPRLRQKDSKMDNLINEYDIEIRHITGKENIAADYYSRNLLNNIRLTNFTLNELITVFHEENGHPGVSSSYYTLKRFIEDKQLLKALTEYVRSCELCQKCKNTTKKYGKLQGNIATNEKLVDISSDIVGPFDGTNYIHEFSKDKIFIITITDRHSRFTRVYFTESITGNNIITCIERWCNEHGVCKSFLSDQGKGYINKELQKYLQTKGIKHYFSSIYNPTGNSISERINKQINECMRIYNGYELIELKRKIENRLNNILNRNLGVAPIEIITKNNPFNLYGKDFIIQPHLQNIENLGSLNAKRTPWIYKIGDLVLVKNFQRAKSDPLYNGPYEVLQIGKEHQRMLILESGRQQWHNIKNLKPFRNRQDVVNYISIPSLFSLQASLQPIYKRSPTYTLTNE